MIWWFAADFMAGMAVGFFVGATVMWITLRNAFA